MNGRKRVILKCRKLHASLASYLAPTSVKLTLSPDTTPHFAQPVHPQPFDIFTRWIPWTDITAFLLPLCKLCSRDNSSIRSSSARTAPTSFLLPCANPFSTLQLSPRTSQSGRITDCASPTTYSSEYLNPPRHLYLCEKRFDLTTMSFHQPNLRPR